MTLFGCMPIGWMEWVDGWSGARMSGSDGSGGGGMNRAHRRGRINGWYALYSFKLLLCYSIPLPLPL